MSYGADTPALDFCRKVQTWQGSDANQAAGLVVVMNEREEDTLGRILSQAACGGSLTRLEDEARLWLVGYRELEDQQRVLTEAQRYELHAVTDRLAREPGSRQGSRQRRSRFPRPVLAAMALALAVALGLGVNAVVNAAHPANPVPAGQAQPAAPQPVQPGLTALQQFRHDWAVPAGAQADAGNPSGLVLLENGLYYPAPWFVPAHDAAWAQDTTGAVSAVKVLDNSVTFTDQDGNAWTVGTDQPFVLAPDPGTIHRIDPAGTVWSMPASHGITVRTHI
jgi:hypothetical protein